MNDKREGTGSAPDSVQHIIAAIESIDRKLAENGVPDSAAAIEKARAHLREAIGILTLSTPLETGEDAGPTKRRVKIKAESEIASPSESPPAAAAKGPASRAKSTRGSRAPEAARNGSDPANAEKVPNGSLLARLGAAAETNPPAPTPAETTAEPTAASAPPPKPENTADATAQRLALLEAEIADLTEAVTATPTRPASLTPAARFAEPEPERAVAPAASARASETAASALSDQDVPGEDDEIAEITIIGADGAPSAPASRAERYAPRVFREGPSTAEEEAEVEIRGQSSNRPARRGSDDHKSHPAEKNDARGKWRLFRGSR